ncbi:uncharacterized protein LOC117342930 [Pecten maximus]|uniref:uncharacterized protein LOC117342930 n=1 Tax=Pecten maximus TaxID=6579 RepID=UPI001457F5C6|nr:uncharacterized protein LOC117342930 [Pecten maximus]
MASVPREGAGSKTPVRSTEVSTAVRVTPIYKNILPLDHDVYAPPMSEVVIGNVTLPDVDSAITGNSDRDVGGAPPSPSSIYYANRASSASHASRDSPRESGPLFTSGPDFSQLLINNQLMVQQQAEEMKKMREMIDNMQQTPLQSARPTVNDASSEEEGEDANDSDQDHDPMTQGFPEALHELMCDDTRTEDMSPSDDGIDSLEMFFAGDKNTGPDISSKLAGIVNNSVGVKVSEQKRKDISNKHSRPNNCKLQVPRVNKGIWKTLRKSTKDTDVKWQTTQQMLCMGMYPLLKLTDLLYNASKDQGVLLKKDLMSALTLANDSFISLQVAFTDVSLKRRFMLKSELNKEFKDLCNTDNPITDQLFGDDLDTQIKKLEEAKVGKKMGKTRKQPSDRTAPYPTKPSGYQQPSRQGQHFQYQHSSRGNYGHYHGPRHTTAGNHQAHQHQQNRGRPYHFLGKTRPRGKSPR